MLAGAAEADGAPDSATLVHAVTNARVDSEMTVFRANIEVLQIDGMTRRSAGWHSAGLEWAEAANRPAMRKPPAREQIPPATRHEAL
jgi:hypothetical protein